VIVITTEGRVARTATARVPGAGTHFPRLSVAGRSVYFLDGDADLKALRPDGTIATVGKLPGGPNDRVIFAVSPDERQVAYTVLHYTVPLCPPGSICSPTTTTSLRVSALDGTQVHEISSGPTVEFPIGWRDGRLVISVAASGFIQNPGEVNPYFAEEYRLADPADGTRRFSTRPACDRPAWLTGPVTSSGTICRRSTGNIVHYVALGWDGASAELYQAVDGPASAGPPIVLSLDGRSAAAPMMGDGGISILSQGSATRTAAVGAPAGWFDGDRLLFLRPVLSASANPAVLDRRSNTVVPVTLTVSGQADPYAPFFIPIPPPLR